MSESELLRIRGVGLVTATRLGEAGITSAATVAGTTLARLVEVTRFPPARAMTLRRSASALAASEQEATEMPASPSAAKNGPAAKNKDKPKKKKKKKDKDGKKGKDKKKKDKDGKKGKGKKKDKGRKKGKGKKGKGKKGKGKKGKGKKGKGKKKG